MLLIPMRLLPGLRRLVAVGGLIAGNCLGQAGGVVAFNGLVPPADGHRCTVTGSVSNSVTGEPVRRALVRIGQFTAFSGADGHFEIDGVNGGQYNATAQRPGFFDPSQASSAYSVPSMIAVGPNTPAITLKLVPESVIQGRVLSNTGEPVENAQVQVLSEQIVNGRKMLQPRSNDATDDAGEYRIENLVPGTYYLQVLQQPVFGWGSGMDATGSNRQVYPEEFYANAPDLASATALQLKPGESAQVDFTLSPKTAYRVSGTLTPAAPNGIFVSLQDASGNETQVGIQFDPRTGRWMLPAVPPGGWNIVFRGEDQPGDAYYAEQRVDVGSSDIENLQIVLQPLPPIPVQVLNAPEGAVQPVQVQLIPQNARLNRQQYGATPDGRNPAGPLFLKEVTPGAYDVVVQSNGPACVDSIQSGNVDLTRDPLVVAPGAPPQPIQVTLRQDCANLDVMVQSQDHAGMAGLILVSDSQAFEPKVAFVSTGTHAGFGPLTPGTYHLYAVSNLNGLEYSNPEAMRNVEGQEITLTPNQQGTASISVAGSAVNE